MREIKFRGLRVDGKGWVYGDLVINKPTRATRIVSDFGLCTSSDYTENGLDHCTGNFSNVIPETVGQFTGLQDKNGVDIYEGDVCRGPHDFGPAGFEDRTFTVFYDINLGYQWNYWDLKNIEVIGNIHESKT